VPPDRYSPVNVLWSASMGLRAVVSKSDRSLIMAKANGVKFGVHSEVCQLHKVMVCAPGKAHARLTPSNKEVR
jgi:hypothetical protein